MIFNEMATRIASTRVSDISILTWSIKHDQCWFLVFLQQLIKGLKDRKQWCASYNRHNSILHFIHR